MIILVTGGAGFIASHLQDVLIENGCQVISVDVIGCEKCGNIRHFFDNDNFEYSKMGIVDTD